MLCVESELQQTVSGGLAGIGRNECGGGGQGGHLFAHVEHVAEPRLQLDPKRPPQRPEQDVVSDVVCTQHSTAASAMAHRS